MFASPLGSPRKCWRWYHPVLLLLIIVVMIVLESTGLKSRQLTAEEEKRASVEFNKKTIPAGQAEHQPPDTTVENKTKPFATTGIRWVWCGEMALLAMFVLVAGHGITGLWRGAFIDSTNR